MLKITDEINDILELGYSISTERYYFKLFDLILDGCMKFTNADGGSLYIEDDHIKALNIKASASIPAKKNRSAFPSPVFA